MACIRGERPVFSGVSFRLERGGALALVGPNGAGKSSLLRILAGLLKRADGTLEWDSAPIDENWAAHRGRLHYVGHLDAVKPTLTVAENLDGWARFRGAARAAPEALAALGIEDLADVFGRYLSAGQKRRLALARVLATPAPLWLLDEPTVTLDADAAARVEAMIAAHRAGGGMTIVATHGEIAPGGAQRLDLGQHAVSAAELLAGQGHRPEEEEW
ncbi:MAG: heme ABC exporter ATP-binding protein CcmA [Rhodospirillales bacterium]|nr:heme ABC exporter ATP-binding protein CcmA [Rhodospirillales bacterium]MDE0378835.1 heme ABC exporter ATP-binding protein CcmA [Rhodospirillales bacterium]